MHLKSHFFVRTLTAFLCNALALEVVQLFELTVEAKKSSAFHLS